MATAAVTEISSVDVSVDHPGVEIVRFTTASTGDYYDCRKLKIAKVAFASQSTTDGVDIQCAITTNSNGSSRVTLTLESGNVVTGSLIIFGGL